MKKGNGKSGSKATATTIYERIGGESAIRSAIDSLYARILGDVILSPFFASADVHRIKQQQVQFFSQALGGPGRYTGPAMRPLHASMKIEQRHFDRMLQHLITSLKSLNIDDATAAEILETVRPLGKDIVTIDTGEDSLAADNREALVFKQLIENSPINVMRADTNMVIRYINDASRKTLEKLAHLLPCPVDKVVGSSIDIFHKNPAHQRAILSDPRNLPRQANIQLGPETLSLLVSPVYDAQQKYLGAMVTWEVISEKIRLQKEVNEWAAQVEALQKFQAVVHFSMEGTVLYANENLLKLYGYSFDEIKGKHHSMCIDVADPSTPRIKEMWDKLNRGESSEGEFKRIGKDHKEVWIRGWYNVIKDKDGKPYKVIGYISDVTAERLAAASSEGKLAAIDKSQIVLEFAMDGTVERANENFLRTMGYSAQEVIGKHQSMFMSDGKDALEHLEALWAKLKQGQFVVGENKRIGKGGKEVWLSAIYNPILDMNGRPFKVIEYATDMTEQKMTNANFQGQIAAIGKAQAVIEFNLDGTILDANENFLTTLGYRLEEIKGRHHSMFVEQSYRESSAYREFWAKLNRGEYEAGEFKRVGKGGKEVWIQASYNPIFDLNGKPYKVVKYATDVTERKMVIDKVAGYLDKISKGDIPPKITDTYSGDFNLIRSNLNTCIDNINALVADANLLSKAAVEGKLSTRADAGKHQGDFRKIVQGVDDCLDAVIGPLNVAADYVDKISKGAIPAKITDTYNGDFNVIKNNLNTCIDNINALVADAEMLAKAAVEGKLSTRANPDKHQGDYRKIVQGVNTTLDAVIKPVEEAGKVLATVADGDLTAKVVGQYQGDHAEIKDHINVMTDRLRASMKTLAENVAALTSASKDLSDNGQQMSANSEETSAQANVVAKATQQVNENLQSVATGAEEMTLTVRSIASNASEAAKVAGEAVKTAHAANETVSKLGESSAEIGQVIKVITSIAQQTNLLALNATIEAARAGEAGKGFAVVANEVKELAKQTAKATEEISQKITTIQHDTKGAVEAIGVISETINKINEISTTIATAVEEQSATTNEMSRNVAEAAKGSGEISQNIQGVAQAAEGTAASAQNAQKAALELAEMAAQRRSLVERFKIDHSETGRMQARAASASR